ncbi:hypothetical protein HRW14_24610 [Streptomyces lunaelactis]|uniref:hypothetical protein n=1 Tax=Streptomyces lunaelactis TaxID=1535768 RepID=UPI0015855BBB|nr:hypothetical protein [Streptomyces lunaelactis]NUK04320.1 hypothetical protein [Streptomyces lunaelactis]NUK18769.1 hypothetical protein [Streptomyces lunaelactis]NUK26141.1 hypothetical protein [Streptomyces lunaelactis]NUK36014.1 hypothetical protein [Streptomyces lunaelactis]NUK44244.1 hypothetical protein [Streptomyces lunaelactis]
MNALPFLVSFMTSGRLHGLGIGSTLSKVDQTIHAGFVDVVDDEGLSLRRDYGFLEFSFNPGPEWVMANCSIELHKLASSRSMAKKWRKSMQVHFPQYLAWDELRAELSRAPGTPSLKVTGQGGFLEYRAAATDVSVIVSDDHEARGRSLGHGDVWSVSLWSAERTL